LYGNPKEIPIQLDDEGLRGHARRDRGPALGPGGRFLPAAGVTDRVLPAIRGEFRVDVRDNDDEIMVVADSRA